VRPLHYVVKSVWSLLLRKVAKKDEVAASGDSPIVQRWTVLWSHHRRGQYATSFMLICMYAYVYVRLSICETCSVRKQHIFCRRSYPRLGRAQLYLLSLADTHTVAQNQYTGKYSDIVHNILSWQFDTCKTVNCHTMSWAWRKTATTSSEYITVQGVGSGLLVVEAPT